MSEKCEFKQYEPATMVKLYPFAVDGQNFESSQEVGDGLFWRTINEASDSGRLVTDRGVLGEAHRRFSEGISYLNSSAVSNDCRNEFAEQIASAEGGSYTDIYLEMKQDGKTRIRTLITDAQ